MIIELMLIAYLKVSFVLIVIAEGALILDNRMSLALMGVPAVAIMIYASRCHVRLCREKSGTKAR